MEGKSYRDLDAWKHAVELVTETYRATEGFPKSQTYSLAQQIQRSAVSVPSNIAEGQGRKSPGEFTYHIRVARGSLYELETQMIVAKNLGYVDGVRYDSVLDRIQNVGRLINGLLRYLDRAA